MLDALDIKNGASYAEIMMTTDGPVLIEVGARLQGGIVSSSVIDALGNGS